MAILFDWYENPKTSEQQGEENMLHSVPPILTRQGQWGQQGQPLFFSHTCARYNKVENEFPNDTNEEEQLTEGSEPYFPLPAFPQDDIWPELLP